MNKEVKEQAPHESMRTYYKHGRDLKFLFERDVWVQDNRSNTMPEIFKGLVIGFTLDKVLIRRGGVITDWYPLNSESVKVFL